VSKKRRTAKRIVRPNDTIDSVYLTEYTITSEPIEDTHYQRLPAHVKDAVERLHTLAQQRPHAAIPELLQWIEQYPTIPMLYNFLSVAYSHAGDREKSEQTAVANYQHNPDYLFARVNYAEICLARSDYAKVAEIFNHTFDLKLLYPKRSRFHISEFAGFMGVIGVYFLETGERDTAEKVYAVLRQAAPDHLFTQRLGRKLNPNLFQRLMKRIASQP
jgi:tetratricopeptide (TPR) repeat protein